MMMEVLRKTRRQKSQVVRQTYQTRLGCFDACRSMLLLQVLYKFCGSSVEVLWKFYASSVEVLRKSCASSVEVLWLMTL